MKSGAVKPEYVRQRGGWSPFEITSGVMTTLGLHALLVGLLVLGTYLGDRSTQKQVEQNDMEFEEVEMLALGKEKPKQQLPRISNPAPPEPKQETVTLDKSEPEPKPDEPEEVKEQVADEKKAADKPAERKPDPEQKTRREEMMNALDSLNNPRRPTNEVVPEGSKKGVKGGTATDPELASQKATYQTKVRNAIVDRWLVPTTISDDQLTKLAGSVVVRIWLADNGSILRYEFLDQSSNEQFNSSIERALRQFQPTGGGFTLPLPDHPKLRSMVLNQPLNLRRWDPTRQP